ncbi:MAG: hypothetical protein ABIY70_17695 [Capsulimonas sp.]|uniref:hypothetical protein n=1 Tax=Capsulimonas sp. TaxID=2494211 RepID=UPI0032630BBF
MSHRYGHHHKWWVVILIAGDVALLTLLIAATTRWENRQIPLNEWCPKCSEPLQWTGNGFYDSLLPETSDIITGAGYWIIHIIAIVLMLRMP